MKFNLINYSNYRIIETENTNIFFRLLFFSFLFYSCNQPIKKAEVDDPTITFNVLFNDIVNQNILKNPKEFLDAEPKLKPAVINDIYKNSKGLPDFDLKIFVKTYFNFYSPKREAKANDKYAEFIVDKNYNGSLLPLKTPRLSSAKDNFEFLSEDLFLTILSLKKAGRDSLAKNILVNAAQLIQDFGYHPFGDRTYYFGRSNLPFFALSVEILAENDSLMLRNFLPQIQREYNFWMSTQKQKTSKSFFENNHSVTLNDSILLNRFFSENEKPRPENYLNDITLSKENKIDFKQLNAYSESHYFSPNRFIIDEKFRPTDFLAFDLNAQLYLYETILAKAYLIKQKEAYSKNAKILAEKRLKAIQNLFWDKNRGLFNDFEFKRNQLSQNENLVSFYALFTKIATKEQAKLIVKNWNNRPEKDKLIKQFTPLFFYVAYKGLQNYGFNDEANALKSKITLIEEKNSLAYLNLITLLF